MDRRVMDYLMDKMDSRRGDRRDYGDERRGVRGSGRDRRDSRDYEDERDYGDERRDVRGSGRGDRRDSRDYEDERDYEDSRRRFSYEDGRDYHKEIRLAKSDMHEWKRMLENADGTRGPHYDIQQIMSAAEKHDVKFKDFTEAEFCMAVNMMYADYCHALKKFVEHDKLLECCMCLAKAFLEDEDGPEASEKLALYYHCIVNA